MPDSNQLFRLLNEMLFILVGALLAWVAASGPLFLFDPRRPAWLALTAILLLWGLRTWRRAPRIAVRKMRLATRIGGASLSLAGALLLSMAWVPFRFAGLLLAAAGSIFVLRGLVNAALLARS